MERTALARSTATIVDLLASLYAGQQAQVRTEAQSRWFNISRGTKQGDPLSSLIFNSLLEDVVQNAKKIWHSRGYGIALGFTHESPLTNLRFADDVLLTATSLRQVTAMLGDLSRLAGAVGLCLHPEKTKILSNATKRNGRAKAGLVNISGMDIGILPLGGSVKYLGRMVSFESMHEVELDHRLRQAWKAFMCHRDELVNKKYKLRDRLRLFDSVVSPVALYGSQCWTLTKPLQDKLVRAQRRMLRMVFGVPRRRIAQGTDTSSSSSSNNTASSSSDHDNLEPWKDWIQRVTHEVEKHMDTCGVEDWRVSWRNRQWKFCGRIGTLPADRWTSKILSWEPDGNSKAKGRRRRRPRKRWSDDICVFLSSRGFDVSPNTWQSVAANPDAWHALLVHFCQI